MTTKQLRHHRRRQVRDGCPGRGARSGCRPGISAISAVGSNRQAGESPAVGENHDGAARAATPATIVLYIQSILAVGAQGSGSDERPRADEDDAPAGGSAAIDASWVGVGRV